MIYYVNKKNPMIFILNIIVYFMNEYIKIFFDFKFIIFENYWEIRKILFLYFIQNNSIFKK